MEAKIYASITLVGETPLVLDNGEAVDITTPISREISKILSMSGQMTDEQSERLNRLKWQRSLYWDDGVVFPTRNVLRAAVDAGKSFKLGATIERGGMAFTESFVSVEYDGPDDLDKLWENTKYRFRTVVNGTPTKPKASKIVTTRPIFPEWKLTLSAVILPEILDWEDFIRVIEATGAAGIGNARKLGMGRFNPFISRI